MSFAALVALVGLFLAVPAADAPAQLPPEPPPRPAPRPAPTPTRLTAREARAPHLPTGGGDGAPRSVWDALADCESGRWDPDGAPIPGSADWAEHSGYAGGLQWAAETWEEFRDPWMPAAAYDAPREAQTAVAAKVLTAQGWDAWPVCSRRIGAR